MFDVKRFCKLFLFFQGRTLSLLTLSIIADSNAFVYRQNDEFRDSFIMIFCSFGLLTRVPTCGILEIAPTGGRLKNYKGYFKNILYILPERKNKKNKGH